MTMFVLGLIVGGIVGASLGAVLVAILAVSKRADEDARALYDEYGWIRE